MHNDSEPSTPSGDASLGVWDAMSIIIGIVVGTAIFKSPPLVFQNVTDPWSGIGLWIVGGLLSLNGALCYAELATSYRCRGGDYAFLGMTYGPTTAFLFAWAHLAIILTGSIGAMSFVFADYAIAFFAWPSSYGVGLATVAIVGVTAVNVVGLKASRWTQHLLSWSKVLGLLLIMVAAVGFSADRGEPPTSNGSPDTATNWGLAMVFILYAYGGWNDTAFVAAEVHNRRRNLPRALLGGIFAITLIYVVVNLAYLRVLGIDGLRTTHAPAAELMEVAVGTIGERLTSLLVMISALGAVQGMVFTGVRVYAAAGEDHWAMAWLSKWSRHRRAPVRALTVQAIVGILLVALVGTEQGRRLLDRCATAVGLPTIPWDAYFGGFETLVAASAPIFWLFFLLTGISLFILRQRYPNHDRPFSTPLYPLTPILFCATCGYMFYSSLIYAKGLVVIGLIPVAFGFIVHLTTRGWLGSSLRASS